MSKRQYTAEQKAAYARKRAKARARGGNRKVRVNRAVRRGVKRGVIQMADCTQHYLLSLLNPYDSYGACIPSDYPLKSQKVHAFVRGTMVLGTTGVGFVNARPTSGSETVCVRSTTSTSVGTIATVCSAFTNITPSAMAKLPYSITDFSTGLVQARLVSAGLRIRYTGREDARNGIISSVEAQDHEDQDSVTPSALFNKENLERTRPEYDWTCINYSGPVAPGDIEYSNSPTPTGGNYIFSHVVEGVAGDTYEWEFFQSLEYIGTKAVGKTDSHSDIVGYNKVQEVVKSVAAEKPIKPSDSPSIITRVINAIGDNAGAIMNVGRQIGGIINMDPATILRTALGGLQSTSGNVPFRSLTQGAGSGMPHQGMGMSRMLTF